MDTYPTTSYSTTPPTMVIPSLPALARHLRKAVGWLPLLAAIVTMAVTSGASATPSEAEALGEAVLTIAILVL